jgi:hypothetical protein
MSKNNEKLQILIYWYFHLTLEECQWFLGPSQTEVKHFKVKMVIFFIQQWISLWYKVSIACKQGFSTKFS